MLRHSKSTVPMTFLCSGITKLECQISLGISFLFLICPCIMYLKEKYAKKNQKQKDQKCFKNDCKHNSRRCESYKMYLEGDSSHQAVMIVCELKRVSHISNCHNMYTLIQSYDVFTHNTQYSLLFLIHVQIQCDLAITSFTCVNVCSLNCLNLVFEI